MYLKSELEELDEEFCPLPEGALPTNKHYKKNNDKQCPTCGNYHNSTNDICFNCKQNRGE